MEDIKNDFQIQKCLTCKNLLEIKKFKDFSSNTIFKNCLECRSDRRDKERRFRLFKQFKKYLEKKNIEKMIKYYIDMTDIQFQKNHFEVFHLIPYLESIKSDEYKLLLGDMFIMIEKDKNKIKE